ncbi:coenzyme A biosynthesis bifunctional protein CoaBC [Pseudoalteromonas sp. PS1M3]|jgi:phosphopantothenoylcysteine decarboxylase/phosphopantothenate--cysteine ligase|uniref:bifunctional phosphopantothenoylcysteine decarboxylase/phosphopantothenate--cysteine ligase CoaBC n=1 Tax=unclassified Pseudoalteromonas TaxID=194690 RepID=UPI00023173E4|nr:MULTISPECIES: bifunctional phosphopantothenoylcysteine decarboxylase/phosphopantothenate--cysteine ligase CoaBC [unclassified Pseudoalteromonas]MBL1385824.1 bifunctional phosphopantothenoylcysteine decarboxylase/phosphopantothenate--cysteine ligase CoaBC [Colwellia sp.]TMS82888.1 bifunctional phosphopantothenoylcysteine decarboxylase/phosphopantothenate--cysteine ligase CoaBC [Pseudoalteromonas sp. S554]BBW92750.1 coenzyme A biosynthesis bifunctional protein CoaBC [Pseudoalteromonas sp. PS1M3|tara:strand:+ start:911 stop:2104 length:1194 start_codon:yes stop_codon:yes gene_type:complete
MMTLTNKKIVLGISGGIAAYKCAELVRRLKEHGCEVKVVMTESAKHFITPLTMQAVSGEIVSDSLLDPAAEAAMGHIEFAKWADLILVAPATCNIIAKMATGIADDLLTTLLLATPAKVAVAPAMNQQMYAHAATQANLATLKARNVLIWGPGKGEQACGDVGSGRMLEPHELVALCLEKQPPQILAGKTITITAGPTREPLDPVRFISNHSSGKMGYALAEAALLLGANVNLISGPVTIKAPIGANLINIESAEQLLNEALVYAPQSDAFIGCAAVADYRAGEVATQKMKKQGDELTLTLVKNPDVIAAVANIEKNRPYTVGFAAETQNVESYAKGKLVNKNLDMICANDVSQSGLGFNSDQNALTLYWQNKQLELPVSSKSTIALKVIEQLAKHL